jgi:hypothetical protein
MVGDLCNVQKADARILVSDGEQKVQASEKVARRAFTITLLFTGYRSRPVGQWTTYVDHGPWLYRELAILTDRILYGSM